MMSGLPKIINRGLSQKDKLIAEKHALEKEIQDLISNGVSESQIWHKRARIDVIKKEIKALETKQFNVGADKLNSMMPQQQGQAISPEMMAAAGVER